MNDSDVYQDKSMVSEDSLVMEKSKSVDADQVAEVHEKMEKVQSSFKEMGKKKLTAVKEPEIVPDYKYVTLAQTCDVEKSDSDKMRAVKLAINKYHQLEGEEKEWNEIAVLENIIEACNTYTSGKFSLFKFGKAAEGLKK